MAVAAPALAEGERVARGIVAHYASFDYEPQGPCAATLTPAAFAVHALE